MENFCTYKCINCGLTGSGIPRRPTCPVCGQELYLPINAETGFTTPCNWNCKYYDSDNFAYCTMSSIIIDIVDSITASIDREHSKVIVFASRFVKELIETRYNEEFKTLRPCISVIEDGELKNFDYHIRKIEERIK